MENRTSGIIQETRKHIRKKPGISATQNQGIKQPHVQAQVQPSVQNDQELQLKASRDVRWQLYVTGSCDRNILHVWVAQPCHNTTACGVFCIWCASLNYSMQHMLRAKP